MLQRANAIFTALLIVTYMCFPVFSVFAKDAEADTFAMSGVSAATDGTTATDATTATDGTTDSSQDEDRVASFDDLKQWLKDNINSGKTVTFSDTIKIPENESVSMSGVTVDTANHGLVIEKTVRLLSGTDITGEGVATPVVTIASGGRLDIKGRQSEITATGMDGYGGCAVKIEKNGTFDILMDSACTIRSSGAGAVGIDAAAELKLSDTFIISDGTGIVAGGDVELFLCGIDALVPITTTGGTVLLDTCSTREPVENATVISGKITDIINKDKLYSRVTLGRNISPDLFPDELLVVLDDDNNREPTLPVSWDISAVDTNTAGTYEVPCIILAPYVRLWFDDEFPLTATVEVVDASFPVLYETSAKMNLYTFKFLYKVDDSNSLTIWRSDDKGTNWYDYTKNATMYDDDTLILTFPRIPEHPVLLVFEVEGLGESQILHITWDANQVSTDLGGDRNGGDRGENKLPDTTPPKSSTTSRERTSTIYDKSYESAETANSNEISEPVIGSEIPEIINGNEQSAPPTATRESSPSKSPSQPYTEAATDTPEAPDTATPDTEVEQFEAVQTAAMQEIADVPIEEPADYTENTQGSKPLSDTVIPIVAVSTVGLLGAGTYLGIAGKFSLHSLIKMLAGWFGI